MNFFIVFNLFCARPAGKPFDRLVNLFFTSDFTETERFIPVETKKLKGAGGISWIYIVREFASSGNDIDVLQLSMFSYCP